MEALQTKEQIDMNPTAPEHHETFVLSGDHHHLIPNPQSKKLVIFFTATGAAPKSFNWWRVGNNIVDEASVLFVNGWSNTWYQDGVKSIAPTLEQTIEQLKEWGTQNGITEIYCTGQSMGGYGALLFSALLNGKAMAFGAETVLGLPHSQYERKANKDVPVLYPDLSKAFPDTLDALLLAGERDPIDLFCASKMMKINGVQIKTMRYVGHGPAGHLRNRDRLEPLLRKWITGAPIPSFPEVGFALDRPEFPEPFYKGWCALRDGNFTKAATLLKKAVRLYPASDEARFLYAEALSGLENFEGALEQYSTSFSISNRKEARLGAAMALRRLGSVWEALYTHGQIVKEWPDYGAAWYSMGLCYLKLGRLDKATMPFRRAVELEPRNQTYAKRLAISLRQTPK